MLFWLPISHAYDLWSISSSHARLKLTLLESSSQQWTLMMHRRDQTRLIYMIHLLQWVRPPYDDLISHSQSLRQRRNHGNQSSHCQHVRHNVLSSDPGDGGRKAAQELEGISGQLCIFVAGENFSTWLHQRERRIRRSGSIGKLQSTKLLSRAKTIVSHSFRSPVGCGLPIVKYEKGIIIRICNSIYSHVLHHTLLCYLVAIALSALRAVL